MQPNKSNEIPYELLQELGQDATLQGLSDSSSGIDQTCTTAYITTMYYSALANLYIQSTLPDESAKFADMPRVQIALSRSKADFTVASKWLAENGKFTETSSAKQFYDEATAIDGSLIKGPDEIYS